MKRWLTAVLILTLAMVAFITFLPETKAVSIFTPFGGKIEEYDPAPTACLDKITLPVLTATTLLGIPTLITIEKIKVGKPKDGNLGVLRVNLIPVMPLPTNIKRNYAYMVPGTWVLGSSINLCSVCEKAEAVGEKIGADFAKDFCKSIPFVGEILKAICGITGDCPVTNLVYQIGTGSPIAGAVQGNASEIAKGVCKAVLDKVPLIGSLLSGFCDNL